MSSSHPKISVVIPLYNKGETVERTLRSVLAQTVQDFEIVVVNDGSTDNSADVVRGINDARIRLIDQPNAGVSAARNRGLAEARHDLIAFLDADDEWLPGFLSSILALRRDFPTARLWATSYLFSNPSIVRRPALLRGLEDGFRGILPDYFQLAAGSEPPIWTSAVLVHRAAVLGVGGFPLGVRSGEDLLTWARIATEHAIAFDSQPFAIFHGPLGFAERQSRLPAVQDAVGEGLGELLKKASGQQRGSLGNYLALWHRMRAVGFLQAGIKRRCIAEVRQSAKLGGWSLRLASMVLLSLCPVQATKAIFREWHRFRNLTLGDRRRKRRAEFYERDTVNGNCE